MAISKVSQFESTPTAVSDYEAQNAHIMAFINQVNSQAFILTNPTGTTEPTIKQDTYINHGGTLYTVDTADETITGSPADGNVYIKLSVSGDNLVASYVTDISSYTWNQVYGYLASGTDIILPYLLVKSGTSWTKYRMDIALPSFTNQNLRTTDNVSFSRISIFGRPADVYGASYLNRTISSGGAYAFLSMGSYEIRYFNITLEIASSTETTKLLSPVLAGSTYYIFSNQQIPTGSANIVTGEFSNSNLIAENASETDTLQVDGYIIRLT